MRCSSLARRKRGLFLFCFFFFFLEVGLPSLEAGPCQQNEPGGFAAARCTRQSVAGRCHTSRVPAGKTKMSSGRQVVSRLLAIPVRLAEIPSWAVPAEKHPATRPPAAASALISDVPAMTNVFGETT